MLRGVSFTARPGETVALVGHTGAGKTTIVNLLLRFYEPQRGRITANGVDVRDLPLDEWRRLIGYVQQDIFLFAADVRTNVRLDAPLDDAAVMAAAARVGADRVIAPAAVAARPGAGRARRVGERRASGSCCRSRGRSRPIRRCSCSTRRRARWTAQSEAEISARRSRTLMRGRTTIAIAHRLSTIVGANEILVLHHGEVRERGTHAELRAMHGLYDRLYRLQAGEVTDRADRPASMQRRAPPRLPALRAPGSFRLYGPGRRSRETVRVQCAAVQTALRPAMAVLQLNDKQFPLSASDDTHRRGSRRRRRRCRPTRALGVQAVIERTGEHALAIRRAAAAVARSA